MKITKRTVAVSAKNSVVLQQIMADKKALRERCAQVGEIRKENNDETSTESISLL